MHSHKCEKCGKCCHNFAITLSLADCNREPRLFDVSIPLERVGNLNTKAYMIKKNQPYVVQKGRGQRCPFLARNNTCLIYATRPDVCREYPQTGVCVRMLQDASS